MDSATPGAAIPEHHRARRGLITGGIGNDKKQSVFVRWSGPSGDGVRPGHVGMTAKLAFGA
jgi:hypothetical protein